MKFRDEWWFLQVDLAGVENRIQLMLTRDPKMIELARTPPHELDMHVFNAKLIAPEPVKGTPEWTDWRYMGKRMNHATMRGIGPDRMSDELLKDGVVKTIDECKRAIDKYLHGFYAPLNDYFLDIRKQIVRYKALATTWGDIMDFRWRRLDDQAFQDGYSFPPQGEGAGLISEYGRLPMWDWCQRTGKAIMHLEVHDSLLFSVRPVDAYEVALQARECLERPRVYYGEALTVPLGFGLGRTWDIEREFKTLPSREEFVC